MDCGVSQTPIMNLFYVGGYVMNQTELKNERELDLRDICINTLYHWRCIILISLVLAILLGGYKYRTIQNSYNNDAVKAQEKSYNEQLSTYNTNKEAIEMEIKSLKNSIKHQKEYNNNSILMQMNPYNEQVGFISYYVDTNYKVIPNLTYQNIDITGRIVRYYQSLAQSGDLYNYLTENLSLDIEPHYLREAILFEADYDNGIINITTYNNDKKVCEEIITLIKEYFKQTQPAINKAIGKHELKVVNESLNTVVNVNLEQTQKNNLQLVTDYEIRLTDRQTALSDLVKPLKNVISTSIIIKSIIKYIILGLIIGVFLVCGVLICIYLLSDKLISENRVKQQYNNKILGKIYKYNKQHFGFIDRWLSKLEGNNSLQIDEEEEIKRIAAKIKAIVKLKDDQVYNIMFTGTTKFDITQEICNKINAALNNHLFKLYCGDNINCYSKTIEKLGECNSVVLVEDLKKSSFTQVSNELVNISDLEKNVIGIILL